MTAKLVFIALAIIIAIGLTAWAMAYAYGVYAEKKTELSLKYMESSRWDDTDDEDD